MGFNITAWNNLSQHHRGVIPEDNLGIPPVISIDMTHDVTTTIGFDKYRTGGKPLTKDNAGNDDVLRMILNEKDPTTSTDPTTGRPYYEGIRFFWMTPATLGVDQITTAIDETSTSPYPSLNPNQSKSTLDGKKELQLSECNKDDETFWEKFDPSKSKNIFHIYDCFSILKLSGIKSTLNTVTASNLIDSGNTPAIGDLTTTQFFNPTPPTLVQKTWSRLCSRIKSASAPAPLTRGKLYLSLLIEYFFEPLGPTIRMIDDNKNFSIKYPGITDQPKEGVKFCVSQPAVRETLRSINSNYNQLRQRREKSCEDSSLTTTAEKEAVEFCKWFKTYMECRLRWTTRTYNRLESVKNFITPIILAYCTCGIYVPSANDYTKMLNNAKYGGLSQTGDPIINIGILLFRVNSNAPAATAAVNDLRTNTTIAPDVVREDNVLLNLYLPIHQDGSNPEAKVKNFFDRASEARASPAAVKRALYAIIFPLQDTEREFKCLGIKMLKFMGDQAHAALYDHCADQPTLQPIITTNDRLLLSYLISENKSFVTKADYKPFKELDLYRSSKEQMTANARGTSTSSNKLYAYYSTTIIGVDIYLNKVLEIACWLSSNRAELNDVIYTPYEGDFNSGTPYWFIQDYTDIGSYDKGYDSYIFKMIKDIFKDPEKCNSLTPSKEFIEQFQTSLDDTGKKYIQRRYFGLLSNEISKLDTLKRSFLYLFSLNNASMNVSRLGSGHQPAVKPALTPSFLQENLPINIDKSEIVNTAYNKVDGIPEVDKEKIKNTTFKRIKADPVFILGKQLDVVYKVVQRARGRAGSDAYALPKVEAIAEESRVVYPPPQVAVEYQASFTNINTISEIFAKLECSYESGGEKWERLILNPDLFFRDDNVTREKRKTLFEHTLAVMSTFNLILEHYLKIKRGLKIITTNFKDESVIVQNVEEVLEFIEEELLFKLDRDRLDIRIKQYEEIIMLHRIVQLEWNGVGGRKDENDYEKILKTEREYEVELLKYLDKDHRYIDQSVIKIENYPIKKMIASTSTKSLTRQLNQWGKNIKGQIQLKENKEGHAAFTCLVQAIEESIDLLTEVKEQLVHDGGARGAPVLSRSKSAPAIAAARQALRAHDFKKEPDRPLLRREATRLKRAESHTAMDRKRKRHELKSLEDLINKGFLEESMSKLESMIVLKTDINITNFYMEREILYHHKSTMDILEEDIPGGVGRYRDFLNNKYMIKIVMSARNMVLEKAQEMLIHKEKPSDNYQNYLNNLNSYLTMLYMKQNEYEYKYAANSLDNFIIYILEYLQIIENEMSEDKSVLISNSKIKKDINIDDVKAVFEAEMRVEDKTAYLKKVESMFTNDLAVRTEEGKMDYSDEEDDDDDDEGEAVGKEEGKMDYSDDEREEWEFVFKEAAAVQEAAAATQEAAAAAQAEGDLVTNENIFEELDKKIYEIVIPEMAGANAKERVDGVFKVAINKARAEASEAMKEYAELYSQSSTEGDSMDATDDSEDSEDAGDDMKTGGSIRSKKAGLSSRAHLKTSNIAKSYNSKKKHKRTLKKKTLKKYKKIQKKHKKTLKKHRKYKNIKIGKK